MYYSQLLITRTVYWNKKKVRVSGIRVIGGLKQVTKNKKICKRMGRECKYQAHFTSRAAKDVEWYFEKGIKLVTKAWLIHRDRPWIWTGITIEKAKTKNWNSCFEINSMFLTCYWAGKFKLSVGQVTEGKRQ